MTVRVGELFAGYGGLGMGVAELLGMLGDDVETTWVSEIDPVACRVLDEWWPNAAQLGDVRDVEWGPDHYVEVLCAGFPCQDVSLAGRRRGLSGERSGLWSEVVQAVNQLIPQVVVIENVRGLLHGTGGGREVEPCAWCVGEAGEGDAVRACGTILRDLADLGFHAEWSIVGASDVGAPHRRERVFIVAWRGADRHPGGLMRRLAAWAAGYVAQSGAGFVVPSEHLLPTPVASMGSGGPMDPARRRAKRKTVQLADVVHVLPEDGFGAYQGAVDRWGGLLGRAAPSPSRRGPRGGKRIRPEFVEWMMGLPEGHVTGVEGVCERDALRMLGNGVVPAQARSALLGLLARAGDEFVGDVERKGH